LCNMAKLADTEIRDINQFLAEGRPLPDKYRFLLFDDKREVELVWNGKTNEVTNVVLPFQTIEIVDEAREEKVAKLQSNLFDSAGRQSGGWTNKLIWGDNKLILSSLKSGPLRQDIEAQGGIKLIYIDPPFDVGADFSMDIAIGDATLTKSPSVIEELAYRDTWGKGADSFIAMIYERLSLMRDLLSEDGSIYVHCDWRVNSYMRLILDEIFGQKNFLNQIIWSYEGTQSPSLIKLAQKHDSIFRYAKNIDLIKPNSLYYEHEVPLTYSTLKKDHKGYFRIQGFGDYSEASIQKFELEGRVYHTAKGTRYLKHYIQERNGKLFKQKKQSDVWTDITQLGTAIQKEKLDYPTQKPEKLLARIIETDSRPGDLVADFFNGSGTTTAVAEKLGRKWIGSDLGKFSIHTARKRMISVQRELKSENKSYRAFEILNLGKYERQYYIGETINGRSEDTKQIEAQRDRAFVELITRAYMAEKVEGFRTFVARKDARLVAIGPVNMSVSRLFVDEILKEAVEKQITKVDLLAFDFEMGMGDSSRDDAKNKGIDLALKQIPRDVFDKRAVEKNQVVFNDVSYIEVKPIVKGKGKAQTVSIELTDFSVHYNQDAGNDIEGQMKPGTTKVIVRDGQVIKLHKDKDNEIMSQDILTKKWSDWIDYWSVDFDFESKKEIVRVKKLYAEQVDLSGDTTDNELELDEYEAQWTGSYIFENEWQSFRTKKDRSIELNSVTRELTPGRSYKIAVKVVDIFGNDTVKVIEINL
jgi:adenine-specific DNA-methyltransferase